MNRRLIRQVRGVYWSRFQIAALSQQQAMRRFPIAAAYTGSKMDVVCMAGEDVWM
ncbi:hypothetical protein Dd1591_1771 [Dickeya chrysanthemi Ech1591]|uniref:Uncharacterized protein n=1 Tax=Dickeya chrysanthemi (strain Ech1591) TaxID=561229 RepID=C6CG53_DICC1|nr:hypothetical protein Dd1591_1771 [Dickeya chrysanthemi Ech1591]